MMIYFFTIFTNCSFNFCIIHFLYIPNYWYNQTLSETELFLVFSYRNKYFWCSNSNTNINIISIDNFISINNWNSEKQNL
jgi:hypothetical protein